MEDVGVSSEGIETVRSAEYDNETYQDANFSRNLCHKRFRSKYVDSVSLLPFKNEVKGTVPQSPLVTETSKPVPAEIQADEIIQDKAGLVALPFKSFLQSIQQQYKAMCYEKMGLMLKKHSRLAVTRYDSVIVLFGEGLASFMLKEYDKSLEKIRKTEGILQEYVRSDNSYSNDLSLCFMYMGDAESSQGHYRSAPEYFEKAVAFHQCHDQPSRLEEIFKLERTTLSAMLSKFALSLRNDDRVVDSEKIYRQAMSCPDATPSDIIMARTGLGNLLHSLGSNEKAIPEYLAAIDIAEKEKDYLSLAWTHGNLGNMYLSLGKREKGLSHLHTSLDLTLDYDFDPSSISRALNNLGTAYQSLNELDKAELYFDQALSQAIFASDVVGQARAYGNIGNVYMLLKDFLKAIPHYTEVLRLSRDRSTVYVAYHSRGCALFELAEKKKGEQYQFTKRGEFQFIAIGPDTGDTDQPDKGLDDHTTELYQQSLKDFRKVIKNVESAFSNSSSSTIGLDLYLSLFHINAKTFQKAQDCAFNLRDHYLSLTIAEQARTCTLGELLLKRKSHQLPTTFSTPLNIDAALKLAVELLPDPYTPVVVLSYTGTRLLVWVLAFDGKMVSANSFEQEPDEELFGNQLDMYLRYELADDLTGNIDLYGEEEEKEVEFEEEGEKREGEKEIESDEEKEQESDEEEKREDPGKMDAYKLDGTEILEKATEPVKKEKGDKKSGPARKRKILSDLYKMIAKPLEAILKAVIPEPILHSKGPHKLILIPDNSTKMIPFNALLNEEGGVYFGDKHTLQFFPSLLCLGVMSQAPRTTIHVSDDTSNDALIVGDPSTPAFKFEGEDWTPGPLPHAKKEAQWVGHYIRSPPLLGSEPTKEIVISRLKQAKLIHLATHGSASYGFVLLAGHCYDSKTTLTSSLHYHEDERKLLLYASEIESLRLQSCLVILSSRDSGRGKFKGDEIQGMSHSFLLAGAAAVMTSLWKVPDQSASYFMQYFYRYLLDGHTSSVSLQKSIQSIRSIHHFSQVIHWGGYQLTGSDVRIVVKVSDQDKMVFKALGCPGGVSPFPRLGLLQQLENNLLSSTNNNVQIIYGVCGTDPAETVKDFIAKHNSTYQSIYWCNASHSVVMNKIIEKVVCDYGDHQSSTLLVVDSATVDSVANLIPLSRHKNIQLILVAQSILDYKEMAREVDIELKMGVSSLPAVKPLTELECAQRIAYLLVSNEENDINSKDINSLASSCSGSPSIVKMVEQVAVAGKSALKIENNEDLSVLDVELKSRHEEVTVFPVVKSPQTTKKEVKEYSLSSNISSIVDSLCLSPVSRILLNCASVFNGMPIPKLFLSSLENEIVNASSSSSDSPLTSLSSSSLSSSHITALDCVAELLTCQCVVSYPSPVIVQSSLAKVASSIDTILYIVPAIISEYMWSNMDTVDKVFAIGIAYRTIKKIAQELSVYSHGLADQLFERFKDIDEDILSSPDDDFWSRLETSKPSTKGRDETISSVDSEKRYKQAMSCLDATPSDIIIARTGLGNLLHSLGSNEKAVPEYFAAIDIAEKEKDHISLAWAHGNLGNTYLSLGKREKGLSHLQTSLDLTLDHDFDPSSISRALNNLGTAYQSLNELDKAELYFDQVLSQAIFASDVVGQARAYGNIGNVYMLLKDFLKAIPHYTEVLRLSQDSYTVYVAYHSRGCALFELAEKKKGEQYQFTKRGEFQFIAIGPDTGDMDQPDKELDDHTTELYQQSLKDFRKVIKNVESAFSNSSSSTIGLDLYLSLFHINAKTFQKAQDCAFNLRDHYLSLTIAEQARTCTLGELLLKRKSHQFPTTFSTPLNIDAALKLAVELLPDPYTSVVVLSYTGTRLLVWVLVFDGKMVSANSFEQEPDEELFGNQLDMYLRYELFDGLTGNIDLYGEEEEKEVEFEEEGEKREGEKEIESDEEKEQESDEEEKREDPGKMDAYKLGGTEILEKATEPVKKEKGDKRSGPARKRKILSDLYKMIAKPLEAILKAVIPEPILHSRGPHKLILIPDNSTKMIPFNALLNEEGAYFGDKHTLQFFPSLLCLGVMSQAPRTTIHVSDDTSNDVLIVGDPSTPAFQFEGEDWTPGSLPHAKKEAQWVGHYMGTPPLLGGEPTKDIVLAKLSQAKLIHLATHGSAFYGFVLLAGHCYDSKTTLTSSPHYHEDERKLLLHASEIESLRLQSCLVILSSRDSGRGKFKGDEIQGMSHSFLLAGAAAVMTSLWKVPDQSASYFMQYFYRYLLDGHTSSVSLQKSIQSIRCIHHFSQVIHWGGYQLTGSDVRIVVKVSDQDKMVFKALGCPGGVSPFPHLGLLQQLENNLLSSTNNNVQIIHGLCGTDPAETVKDFIAKHHSTYQSIYWCNASHSVVMNKIIEKVVCDYGDHQSSTLLVVDSATVDSVANLIPLSRHKNIQLILVAQSILDYKEMAREVDIELKMGVSSLPAVKPLTELECAQRIAYLLVSNEENDINSKDINSLASSCSGSPSIVKMVEQVAVAGKSALKIENNEDLSVLDVELKSRHEEVTVLPVVKSPQTTKKEVKEYSLSSNISSVINSLCLSPVSRILLNCVSVFNGVPISELFLSSLENEIINASSSSSSDSPLTSLSSSSLSSSHITAIDCVAELLSCQCIVSYPSPVIVQASSAKVASSIDTILYTVPAIISEYMWSNMDTVDKVFAIGIAYRTIKKKAQELSVYSHGLVDQLFEGFKDIDKDILSSPDGNFWSRLETSKPSTRAATPPPVPSSIFDVKDTNKTGQVGGAKSSGGGASSDGWGDWDDSEFESVQDLVRGVSENEETGSTIVMNEGWGFEGGGWEDATPMSKPAAKQEQESERQRELERKREERRARQEAARKKRSAGMSLKPTGLGAVKKD